MWFRVLVWLRVQGVGLSHFENTGLEIPEGLYMFGVQDARIEGFRLCTF